ncbi:hypothetical protein T265_05057 [Opisthorchis viverrini]|uniref:Uncharacterized protein n=1 Tax=Opisthorchis viverrini TaxID=6198 RepID=A0A074ZLQ2_OPIVI|nr:hypothetical protein T265_05057 [Opisthorchis viverrini]KER28011.1 hypothetical protein T265_05057 [Opisthorchis viverrini]
MLGASRNRKSKNSQSQLKGNGYRESRKTVRKAKSERTIATCPGACEDSAIEPNLTTVERKIRPPLISLYRGEVATRSKSHGDLNPDNPKMKNQSGCLFQTHKNTRDQPPYYIIHPEWLSEIPTIRRLGLSPRPTPLPTASTVNQEEHSHSVWELKSSVEYNNGNLHSRCKSAPANRPRNPITWDS